MNLNEFAKQITLKEGKVRNMDIAQVKEVLKITLSMLKRMTFEEVISLLRKK